MSADPRADVLAVVRAAITNTPRSRQASIGPSEVGHPCARRVAHRLAGTRTLNERHGWRPTVGTAVHDWLAATFDAAGRDDPHGDSGRWLTEHRVAVTDTLRGSCDLYDRATATVIDHKVVGTASLRNKRVNGPGEQYVTQVHLYAHGWLARGMPVRQVAIMFWPMSGELEETHWWSAEYDPDVTRAALNRLAGIEALTAALGPAALPATPTYCSYCPWFRRGHTDLSTGCPGEADTKEQS